MKPWLSRVSRSWRLALIALGLPLLLLGSVSLYLRLLDYGYDPNFLVSHGPDEAVTNPEYGRRFFRRHLARAPVAGALARRKAADEYRIVVLGGSAAMGTPEPGFSFGRILETMLEENFPGVRFTVLNAAMTAANSHVALTIGRELADYEPDLFVVYTGHNEVVGPFGPGTVFQPFAGSRLFIRAVLALRATRIGQLFEDVARALGPPAVAPARWRGMAMFAGHEVHADDPRLGIVYDHLEHNLKELIAAARDAGAGVVLMTAAANLRHSPPFASRHRPGLPADGLQRWRAHYDKGSDAVERGDMHGATDAYAKALALDDGHAELHFRLADVYRIRGDVDSARQHYVRARDLDVLRFRADSEINARIRKVAGAHRASGVSFIDAEVILAGAPEEAGDGLTGDALFYEHVHLNFRGNYRLAEAVFHEIVSGLPDAIRGRATKPVAVAAAANYARRLLLTSWDRWQIASAIEDLTERAPFIAQLDHAERQAARHRQSAALGARARRRASETVARYSKTVMSRPDDVSLRQRYAQLLQWQGMASEALTQWRRLLQRFPKRIAWLSRLAFSLADSGDTANGIEIMRGVVAQRPWSVAAHVNLGDLLLRGGRLDDAAQVLRRAVTLDESDPTARYNLALVLERQGRRDLALAELRGIVTDHPQSSEAHLRWGSALERAGDLEGAILRYRRATALAPHRASAWNALGFALQQQEQFGAAMEAYRRALARDPGYALAHFNAGDLALTLGSVAVAIRHYRAGLSLNPANEQARRNLAHALGIKGVGVD